MDEVQVKQRNNTFVPAFWQKEERTRHCADRYYFFKEDGDPSSPPQIAWFHVKKEG